MKYLCTINWRDAPAHLVMDNEVVELVPGMPVKHDYKWVRRIDIDESFRAYDSELWPIDDDMAMAIMAWRKEKGLMPRRT